MLQCVPTFNRTQNIIWMSLVGFWRSASETGRGARAGLDTESVSQKQRVISRTPVYSLNISHHSIVNVEWKFQSSVASMYVQKRRTSFGRCSPDHNSQHSEGERIFYQYCTDIWWWDVRRNQCNLIGSLGSQIWSSVLAAAPACWPDTWHQQHGFLLGGSQEHLG